MEKGGEWSWWQVQSSRSWQPVDVEFRGKPLKNWFSSSFPLIRLCSPSRDLLRKETKILHATSCRYIVYFLYSNKLMKFNKISTVIWMWLTINFPVNPQTCAFKHTTKTSDHAGNSLISSVHWNIETLKYWQIGRSKWSLNFTLTLLSRNLCDVFMMQWRFLMQSLKVGPLQDKVALYSTWYPFQPFFLYCCYKSIRTVLEWDCHFPGPSQVVGAENFISSGKLEQFVGGGMRVILQHNWTFCRGLVFVKGMFWATDFEATHCDLPNYCGPYGVLLQTPPAGGAPNVFNC